MSNESTSRTSNILDIELITTDAFCPYGDVIDVSGAHDTWLINGGAVRRHHRIADVEAEGDAAIISIFEPLHPTVLPYDIELVERHPYGSQAFIPLDKQELIVVVAPPGDFDPSLLRAFRCGGLGVSFGAGTWHAPLIAPEGGLFLIIDRDDPNSNCDVVDLNTMYRI